MLPHVACHLIAAVSPSWQQMLKVRHLSLHLLGLQHYQQYCWQLVTSLRLQLCSVMQQQGRQHQKHCCSFPQPVAC
jgi:hypothetical protein